MARIPFQRLFPLAGISAVPKPDENSPSESAPLPARIPQSQPMQRSDDNEELDLDESDFIPSPISDAGATLDSATIITSSPTSPQTSDTKRNLHDPLSPDDFALLRVAEMFVESFCPLDDGWFFTPSPDEPDLKSYDYDEDQCTTLALHSLVKRASLPIDTFILAALIIRRLKPGFYEEWYDIVSAYQPRYEEDRSREIVVVAAVIIAQKFLHDAIYTLTTWSDIVCIERPDLHNENLHATERLILRHISWRISHIAEENAIDAMVKKAHDEGEAARERFAKYLPEYDDSPPEGF